MLQARAPIRCFSTNIIRNSSLQPGPPALTRSLHRPRPHTTFHHFYSLDPFRRSIAVTRTLANKNPTTVNKSAPLLSVHANNSSSSLTSTKLAQRTEQLARHLTTDSRDNMSYGKGSSEFSTRYVGAKNTLDFRCYLEKDGTPISPFHDVPLFANEQQTVLNMIVEIPRWSNAKLEVRHALLELCNIC